MPVRSATKQELVYQAVRERILSGAWGPGRRIVIEALAGDLATSPVPVREALRRLEAEGLVVHRANVGAQVAPADPTLFIEEMTALAVLEGYATSLAAPALTREDLKALTAITSDMEAAIAAMDPLAFACRNLDFHGRIYERCPNNTLVERMRDVAGRLSAIRRTIFVQIPYRGAQSVAEHRELIALIERSSPAAQIEAHARKHKLHTVENFRAWQAKRPPA